MSFPACEPRHTDLATNAAVDVAARRCRRRRPVRVARSVAPVARKRGVAFQARTPYPLSQSNVNIPAAMR
jgi:hypothetical protein